MDARAEGPGRRGGHRREDEGRSGEVSGRADGASLVESGEVVVPQDAGHDFAATAYAGLVEDRLEVVLDGVFTDRHAVRNFRCVGIYGEQLEHLSFADGKCVTSGKQVHPLGSWCFLDGHCNGSPAC